MFQLSGTVRGLSVGSGTIRQRPRRDSVTGRKFGLQSDGSLAGEGIVARLARVGGGAVGRLQDFDVAGSVQ